MCMYIYVYIYVTSHRVLHCMAFLCAASTRGAPPPQHLHPPHPRIT